MSHRTKRIVIIVTAVTVMGSLRLFQLHFPKLLLTKVVVSFDCNGGIQRRKCNRSNCAWGGGIYLSHVGDWFSTEFFLDVKYSDAVNREVPTVLVSLDLFFILHNFTRYNFNSENRLEWGGRGSNGTRFLYSGMVKNLYFSNQTLEKGEQVVNVLAILYVNYVMYKSVLCRG